MSLPAYQLLGATAALAAAVGLGSILATPSVHGDGRGRTHVGSVVEGVADDALIRGPRLAMINAGKGLGTQRGIGIVDI